MKSYSDKLKDPRWQKKRLQILNRDEFKCRWCGKEEKTLHVHHLQYKGEPWEVPNEWLLTICSDCHENEHSIREDYEADLIKLFKLKGYSASHLQLIIAELFYTPIVPEAVTILLTKILSGDINEFNFNEICERKSEPSTK